MPLFTVGHSDRSIEEFIDLLAAHEVGVLADVRSLPGSRKFPHFNSEALATSLPERGIEYLRIEDLGGRRNKSKTVDPSANGMWRNQSFHNYADWAMGEDFGRALQQFRALGPRRPTVMCSEAVWWRCHRRIIADHLLALGDDVRHIMSPTKADPATLTPGAQTDGATVTYPAEDPPSGDDFSG
ncbi:DUF488 domain-containing protein [Tessaracoccus sp. MC1865]|uniref:DUF488 domain-containing protein n=1 Tax=Tessaracoccus sp. MC1865 TaxID=2760310 RepID=UPI001603A840|nr:DUF488 domain-containing protein [Tessaracoccus sp. MC1865]MBB1483879.1 DUF488 domain-containing protein [Tessaracoccus sp. MC1865]QTO36934.1 DUF488 domain-containing protein [Tessaracoccus sp. MC1865]